MGKPSAIGGMFAIIMLCMSGTAAQSVQSGWDNHFAAFGGQDLDRILLDYSETSRLNIYDFGSGMNRTFYGLAEIRGAFAELFTYLGDNSQNGLAAPVVDVDEERGSVFLVWRAPGAGIGHATDTFDFIGATIAVQTFTIFPADGATPVLTAASSGSLIVGNGEGPAYDRFMHHFAAFGGRDLVANAEDYAEDCVVNVHDLRTGVTTSYHGHDGLIQAFTPLYDLNQSLGLAAPLIRVEEPMNGAHGSVFLQLTWPGVADMWTDTFLAGADGKYHTQNVVYRSEPYGQLGNQTTRTTRMTTTSTRGGSESEAAGSDDDESVGTLIGGIVGGILGAAVIVVVAVVIVRKREDTGKRKAPQVAGNAAIANLAFVGPSANMMDLA